jgi:hypothetical protein
MDGMKLDEAYRQKNGLGPATPAPKAAPAQELDYERFDAAEAVSEPPVATEAKSQPADESEQPAASGFIDKVLQEKDAPKPKKAKKPKAPKAKPAPKPKPVKQPKPAPVPPSKPVVVKTTRPAKKSKPAPAKSQSSQLISIGKVVVFVALAVFCVYNFLEVQRLNDLLGTEVGQQSQNEAKNKELINTISAFRLLPDGEYEVYTVKDKSKLVNDPVFEYAQNGDKVVVYPSSSLTIVYRESEGKIVGESKSSSLTENN